jgi:tRNA G18 (ribose-2'-O)-methylase SpoU
MTSLILHDLRSNHNVGSIFRTADAIGIDKIYLTGYTPAPRDRFGRVNKEIAKTALGAERSVPWEYVADIFELIKKLKSENCQILALEQAENSLDYKVIKLTEPAAIIVGNEVKGVDPAILRECDQIVEIPMRGGKESLNVAVASGILLFRLLDR